LNVVPALSCEIATARIDVLIPLLTNVLPLSVIEPACAPAVPLWRPVSQLLTFTAAETVFDSNNTPEV
jgi:hypothetical protein